jgi:hypothetical protein
VNEPDRQIIESIAGAGVTHDDSRPRLRHRLAECAVTHELNRDGSAYFDGFETSNQHPMGRQIQDNALDFLPLDPNETRSAGFCSRGRTAATHQSALILGEKHVVIHRSASQTSSTIPQVRC